MSTKWIIVIAIAIVLIIIVILVMKNNAAKQAAAVAEMNARSTQTTGPATTGTKFVDFLGQIIPVVLTGIKDNKEKKLAEEKKNDTPYFFTGEI
jgi:uncharacterized protein YpmB